MIVLTPRPTESLDTYLARSVMSSREHDSAVALEFDGTSFVVTSRMTIFQAAEEWRRARHDQHHTDWRPCDFSAPAPGRTA